MDNQDIPTLAELTAGIVAAYVSKNTIRVEDLPALISAVYLALKSAPSAGEEATPEPQQLAVPIKKSVTPDYIISLENGQKFKSLKRHLKNAYGMTPDEYRSKWGLPRDYPMVAPNYAKARSELAKNMGLGRKAAAAQKPALQQATAPAAAPKRRARAKLAA